MKKFHGLTSFHSFPEKLSRLSVTLPILGTLDSGKTFAVTKRSVKTAKLFHNETKAIYDNIVLMLKFCHNVKCAIFTVPISYIKIFFTVFMDFLAAATKFNYVQNILSHFVT